jgi:hypothetical protein
VFESFESAKKNENKKEKVINIEEKWSYGKVWIVCNGKKWVIACIGVDLCENSSMVLKLLFVLFMNVTCIAEISLHHHYQHFISAV